MIIVTLPDGSTKNFDPNEIDGLTIATSIGKKLAQAAVAYRIDGNLVDLSHKLTHSAKIEIVTIESGTGLDILRHTCSHIMAQAVMRLFPETKPTIGPVIDKGFYYDFDTSVSLSVDLLQSIEDEMNAIIKENLPIQRMEWDINKAIQYFQGTRNNPYKVEIIEELSAKDESFVSLYQQGDFVDLCTGPHLPSTAYAKAVKLISVAGSYWRGDEHKQRLQRIYGTAFATQADLDTHLKLLEEAKNRDHRKLGRELDLFTFQDEAPGMPFWLPNGTILFHNVVEYVRKEILKRGYEEIRTPLVLNEKLWHQSGHYENYRENMFFVELDQMTYALKPMNCPGACLLYKNTLHSYRELPIKLAEFGLVHRYERSGVLHGLMRVRSFNQDDAHVFCTPEQAEHEIIEIIHLLNTIYATFGFTDINVFLSTRPEKSIGTDEMWESATNYLQNALKHENIAYTVDEGQGSFYGPKIDFIVHDAIGRSWQLGTCQLDFSMPQRFDLTYEGADGKKHNPIMLHRAIVGSIERFLGVLTEHYSGKFPLWLAPVQIMIIPVSNTFDAYADEIAGQFTESLFRVKVDKKDEKLGYKIRQAQLKQHPYMIIVGEKEQTEKKVSLRSRDHGDLGSFTIYDALSKLLNEVETYSLRSIFADQAPV